MIYIALALVLALVHFAVPLAYYMRMKSHLGVPWGIRSDVGYRPKVTVILPTYNESNLIRKKLENLELQDYPKELVRTLVVDSSNDGTATIVEDWSRRKKSVTIEVVREEKRYGKLHAIQAALRYIHSDSGIIVLTDADAFWEREAISKAVTYLSDPSIGAVTTKIVYSEARDRFLERTYRNYYNTIRVAESKIHSTPVQNGPFQAIEAGLVHQFGLPMFPGSDDSAFGSFLAFLGYRAIEADNIETEEPMREKQLLRKIRRAQCLILNFLMTKRYAKNLGLYRRSSFDSIWKAEWWLHIGNPWLLIISIALLGMSLALHESVIGLAIMGVGLILLKMRLYRTWILQQACLVIAMLKTSWTREVVWTKHP